MTLSLLHVDSRVFFPFDGMNRLPPPSEDKEMDAFFFLRTDKFLSRSMLTGQRVSNGRHPDFQRFLPFRSRARPEFCAGFLRDPGLLEIGRPSFPFGP